VRRDEQTSESRCLHGRDGFRYEIEQSFTMVMTSWILEAIVVCQKPMDEFHQGGSMIGGVSWTSQK
jgi:hypothetical protein